MDIGTIKNFTAKIIFFSFLFLTNIFSVVVAQNNKIVLNEFTENLLIGKQVQILEDKTRQLTFDDILSGIYEKDFKSSQKDKPNYGLASANIWVRFEIENTKPLVNDWHLEVSYPLFDYLTLHTSPDKLDWKITETGDKIAFSKRTPQHRFFVFPLDFSTSKKQYCYLKIDTQGAIQINLNLYRNDELISQNLINDILYGLFFGALLIMALYNLVIFFSLKDKNYLLYSITILVSAVFQAFMTGFGNKFLLPNSPNLANTIIPYLFLVLLGASMVFCNAFLRVKHYAPKFYKTNIIFLIISGLVLIAIPFLKYNLAMRIGVMLLFIDTILMLISGIVCYFRGNKAARFFVLAWGCYLFGAFTVGLRNAGAVDNTFLFAHSIEIMSVFEVFLLALALADRYNIYKKEKEEAQAYALNVQQEANEKLESRVVERTQEIVSQKEELNSINEELNSINEELLVTVEDLNRQRELLQKANESITASINYAKRIQEAMLPSQDAINQIVKDNFILFSPRDIVSGDFYWLKEIKNDNEHKIVVAAVDCTGHGVPGAFMSMIGNDLLNEIVELKHIIEPNKILEELNMGVRNALKQDETHSRDGMDIAICMLDYKNDKLYFSGANNPLYYVLKPEYEPTTADNSMLGGLVAKRVLEIKADRKAIGGLQIKSSNFTTNTLTLSQISSIYLCSDGFQDLFGGINDKKFGTGPLKELLYKVQHLPMTEQKQLLSDIFHNWLGVKNKQTDDILIIGLKP